MTDSHYQGYAKFAEEVASDVASNATRLQKLIPASAASLSGDEKINAIVRDIARRAFRKEPTHAQMVRLVGLYKLGPTLTSQKDPTAGGLQLVVQAILQSPSFLYRVELGKAKADLTTLTGAEVAARLSYAAWNSIPDEELLKAGESGELLTEKGLQKQARRLLDSPKAEAQLVEFYKSIFLVRDYKTVTKKDASIVKSWPDTMATTMITESELFFREVIIKEKAGINRILTAPYAFVNSDTAPIYKVDAPPGKDFVKTTLNAKERIGILTQVGFLAGRSKEKDSHAIFRGFLIADKLLCLKSGNPPAGAGMLETNTSTMLTTREFVDQKTGPKTCGGSCHGVIINPSGYAFENFDAAGNYRTTDNGKPVDTASSLLLKGGLTDFAGPKELVEVMTQSEDLHDCMTKKALNFLYARPVDKEDSSIVSNLTQKSLSDVSTYDVFYDFLTDSRIKLRGTKGK